MSYVMIEVKEISVLNIDDAFGHFEDYLKGYM
jgi:hypothetical protein